MPKLSIEEKKEYQRKYDAETYWKNPEENRRIKIVQKISKRSWDRHYNYKSEYKERNQRNIQAKSRGTYCS